MKIDNYMKIEQIFADQALYTAFQK